MYEKSSNPTYTFGTDLGSKSPLSTITTTSTTGTVPQYISMPSGISISGMSNATTTFWPPVKIRFGFTLKFKTEKAKLKKEWNDEADYSYGTPYTRDELKKIL